MFDSNAMMLIFVIAIVALVGIGALLALIGTLKKRRQLRDLTRSSDFQAVYDEESDSPG